MLWTDRKPGDVIRFDIDGTRAQIVIDTIERGYVTLGLEFPLDIKICVRQENQRRPRRLAKQEASDGSTGMARMAAQRDRRQ